MPEHKTGETGTVVTYDVVGTRVAATSPTDLAARVRSWVRDGKTRYVCFSDVNALIQGVDNKDMRVALDEADLVAPDGKPLAVVGRTLRGLEVQKTSGPDFFESFCAQTAGEDVRHFFLGGLAGVAQALGETMERRYPGLKVVGTFSPPRFPFTPAQNDEMLAAIRAARPDIVWVGLGAPRQEVWMHANRAALTDVTMFGVGAAFDFSAGRVKRAPVMMQRLGLEWLYRVSQEPQRLLRRYAVAVPRFLLLILRDQLRRSVRQG